MDTGQPKNHSKRSGVVLFSTSSSQPFTLQRQKERETETGYSITNVPRKAIKMSRSALKGKGIVKVCA
jgi:hypothetical protein